jgi:hypothetical protein
LLAERRIGDIGFRRLRENVTALLQLTCEAAIGFPLSGHFFNPSAIRGGVAGLVPALAPSGKVTQRVVGSAPNRA